MSRIFGYIGSDDCREYLLSALDSWCGDTVGIGLKIGDELLCTKDVGTVDKIRDDIGEISLDCNIGLAQSSISVRAKPSRLSSSPSCNNLFVACMDGRIDNFDYLKERSGNPFPILTDEDLLLALLCVNKGDNFTDLLFAVDEMLLGNPTYAFFSNEEDVIFCKKGNAPLYIGVAKSGHFVSSELALFDKLALRYFTLNDGEFARITGDRVSIFDAKHKRVKRAPLPVPVSNNLQNDYPICDEIFYCPLAVKSVANVFVNNDSVAMNELKLSRHSIEKIKKIIITGASNDYFSASFSAYNFGLLTDIPTFAFSAGELQNYPIAFDKGTMLIAVSSTGEDMDAINVVKRAKAAGTRTLAVTPCPLSYLADLADIVVNPLGKFDNNSISLRGFISSYMVLSLLALYIGGRTGVVNDLYMSLVLKMTESLSSKVTSSVKSSPQLELASKVIKSSSRTIFTGYLGDKNLAGEACSRLRDIAGVSSVFCQLDELESNFGRDLEGATVVAFISDDSYLQTVLHYLRRARSLGATVLIYTATNIEEEIKDFDMIVSINDSLPLLNPVPIITSFYKTVVLLADESVDRDAV